MFKLNEKSSGTGGGSTRTGGRDIVQFIHFVTRAKLHYEVLPTVSEKPSVLHRFAGVEQMPSSRRQAM